MHSIDFNKVIAYSKANCKVYSQKLCATYVKRAFAQGGCKYMTGNGWDNQRWCQANNFKLIGDFIPIDKYPRAHNGKSIQFPVGYKQQVGDVCLIKTSTGVGHMCYAMGTDLNSWVSDYFQKPPAQQAGAGPYCYGSNIYERVQIWRHASVLNNAPVLNSTVQRDTYTPPSYDSQTTTSNISGVSNNVKRLPSATEKKENVTQQDEGRKNSFESLLESMIDDAPDMGRDIVTTSEFFDSNILKTPQESTKIIDV